MVVRQKILQSRPFEPDTPFSGNLQKTGLDNYIILTVDEDLRRHLEDLAAPVFHLELQDRRTQKPSPGVLRTEAMANRTAEDDKINRTTAPVDVPAGGGGEAPWQVARVATGNNRTMLRVEYHEHLWLHRWRLIIEVPLSFVDAQIDHCFLRVHHIYRRCFVEGIMWCTVI